MAWRLGAAQAFMPLLGWALGLAFASLIRNIDHWIAFALLAAIGGRMVHARLAAGANDDVSIPLITGWGLAGVALATSIDAAAAGVTIAFLQQPVLVTCAIIGIVTITRDEPHLGRNRGEGSCLIACLRHNARSAGYQGLNRPRAGEGARTEPEVALSVSLRTSGLLSGH